jgi:hypothetical protein
VASGEARSKYRPSISETFLKGANGRCQRDGFPMEGMHGPLD